MSGRGLVQSSFGGDDPHYPAPPESHPSSQHQEGGGSGGGGGGQHVPIAVAVAVNNGHTNSQSNATNDNVGSSSSSSPRGHHHHHHTSSSSKKKHNHNNNHGEKNHHRHHHRHHHKSSTKGKTGGGANDQGDAGVVGGDGGGGASPETTSGAAAAAAADGRRSSARNSIPSYPQPPHQPSSTEPATTAAATPAAAGAGAGSVGGGSTSVGGGGDGTSSSAVAAAAAAAAATTVEGIPIDDYSTKKKYTNKGGSSSRREQQQPSAVVAAVPNREDQLHRLRELGFPRGLALGMTCITSKFPLRLWVVDNSGSMNKDDGQSIIQSKFSPDVRIVDTTRWKELQATIEFHAMISAMLRCPTDFRMLNDPGPSVGPQRFGIAVGTTKQPSEMEIEDDLRLVQHTIRKAEPRGVTPLTEHVHAIREGITAMLPSLRETGQRVAIILATDGLPTNLEGCAGDYENERFVQSLRTLEGLPVWVVIRLCTDNYKVVHFYHGLDEQLELSIEVLDDLLTEAAQVHKVNPWLNYALPLHRCREMGFHDRVFDMVDERPLTIDEVREFCVFLFGADAMDGTSSPAEDWYGFKEELGRVMEGEVLQWNPMKRKPTPWIDVRALERRFGDHSVKHLFKSFTGIGGKKKKKGSSK